MKRIKLLLVSLIFPVLLIAQPANRYDVVIDEIFADPSPQVGLPNSEFIELKNTTTVPFNLSGWRIGDLSGLSGPMPNFVLQPDSFVIVCSSGAVAALAAFGTAIPVTAFPSLDNDGDQVFLRSAQNKIIHGVLYTLSWYQNELKKDGGWSLEMIDTKSPCAGISNWKASVNTKGGTPGMKNSIDGINVDQGSPQLKKTYTIDSITIVAVFDEPVDSLRAADIGGYKMDNGLSIVSASALAPLFDQVQLKLSSSMLVQRVYHLVVSNLVDCKGNVIGAHNAALVGNPQDASASDAVVNEILFNPRSSGYDYVEVYNRSNKIIDAAKLYIANRNTTGTVSSIKKLSEVSFYLFPGEYIVATENPDNLRLNYLVSNPEALLMLSPLPSLPDDKGDVVLLNMQGDIIDEVRYEEAWHFKLIDNPQGVSLERIDPDGPSQSADNWHSAASTAGFGTPTYKNSQYKKSQVTSAAIEVMPKVFSPDNDGHEDITRIQYKVTDPGSVANIVIYDGSGRLVRYLVKNAILGINGTWNWDGLDENGKKLPVGIYVIFTEIFNLQGKKESFKNTVVVARKL